MLRFAGKSASTWIARAWPLGCTAAAALLYTLACPPYGWSLAAWIVPGLLLTVGRRLDPARAACCGVIFGVLMGYGLTGWALQAALAYFQFDRLAAGLFVLGVWLLNAGIPFAMLLAAYAVAVRRLPSSAVAPAGAWLWVLCEVIRSRLFTGMPWELLGHTQYRNLLLVQIADLGGVFAVSFVVALLSLALAETLTIAPGGSRPLWQSVVGRLAPATLVLMAVLAYGAWARTQYARPVDARHARTVAIVQGDIPEAFRWKRAFFARALITYAGLTRTAAAARPDLIVWPENAVNFYLDREPMLHAQLRGVAALAREGLLIGGPRLTATGDAHNSAYLLTPDGGIQGTYDKQRLLPFAEYDPLPWRTHGGAAEPITYVPGRPADPLATASLRLGTVICYEALFPNLVRDVVRRGADLLVNVSNDSWLDHGDGAASSQHFSMTVFRAIEARRYLVRASASGVSGFVSPYGEPYATVASNTAGTAVATVAPLHGLTPYVRWGDGWVVLGGVLAGGAVARPRREVRAS